MTEYRIWLPGCAPQTIAVTAGRAAQHEAVKRCTRILQANTDALRVEAWRDGVYLAKATRAPVAVAA